MVDGVLCSVCGGGGKGFTSKRRKIYISCAPTKCEREVI